MKMDDIRSDLGDEFIEKITEEFIENMTRTTMLPSMKAEHLRAKIKEVRGKNHDPIFLELTLSCSELFIGTLKDYIKKLENIIDIDENIQDLWDAEVSLQDKMLDYLKGKSKENAKKGGQAKAIKTEKCRNEFLRLVDERKPPFDKSKVGLAEAVLELKPLIVKYAKENQSSVITASTNLPVKWLNQHWNLPKRSYKKT
ncbi:hypothetical protein ACO0KY_14160 [Undibacterium sp. Dicai25W]|uniref:hypothetical protein n=1 Tax=Undibacterium sp. Dicai25W TaxID=3413034 RepID=UPI003BF1CD7B